LKHFCLVILAQKEENFFAFSALKSITQDILENQKELVVIKTIKIMTLDVYILRHSTYKNGKDMVLLKD